MKRYLLVIFTLLALSSSGFAAHIKGGFFTYQYLGPGAAGNAKYRITLTVYMICNPSSGQLSNPINFSIYNAGNFTFVQDVSVGITNQYNLSKVYDEPCITGNETGCYYTIVVYDLASVELPITPGGYIISYQRCCRIAGINNVVNSGSVGNTFAINIPGTGVMPGAETNSSPAFQVNDTAVVCRNSYFQFSFQATDPNSDSLAYEFCDAYEGATQSLPAPTTASAPPYTTVPYASPYTGTQPMGNTVTINPRTGLISGTAPDQTGEFVVCVCVKEYRNGTLLGITRKELHIRVGDCNPLRALLNPRSTICDGLTGFTVSFQNDASGNPSNVEYYWEFGDPASGVNNSSTAATPTHLFTDTGVYLVKLKVSLPGGLCSDSTTMSLKVYPGFEPGFTVTGTCFSNPYQFNDTTRTTYGVVNYWHWNFGDNSTLADTSRIRSPQYTYPNPGPRTVLLIVGNDKGCIDTVSTLVDVLDKPVVNLAFRDTLICIPDRITLQATGSGTFSWTPLTNITNPNTATPTVNPTVSTWYVVTMDDNGCVNKDSVHVRVISSVSLAAMPDTTICRTDPVQLTANTNGLSYSWTPAATLNDPNVLNPVATPVDPTTLYILTASVGTCSAKDTVVVTTVPYPIANAGPNQTICYNTSTQLNGSHNGNRFTWTPASYLSNPNILNPVATPPRTTQYVLSSYDNLGCPKPGRDTVIVTVNPKVTAYAGRDTTVVVGQPLQLQGSGGVSYQWSPATALNNPNIANPVAIFDANTDSIRYKLVVRDAIGCPDSAFVTVKVFKTNPYVFVPTAFTPNNDGRNDVIRPIAVGIQQIHYFSIYNRWGQRVFITTENRKGWDGNVAGVPQNSGVFVWMLSATDYLGNKLFLKGTVTLIR